MLAALATVTLPGLFAGCASEPEPTPAANGATETSDGSWWPSWPHLGVPKVHKIVIQQGNVITQQMVDRLKPGMTKAQAQYVLGRPVLDDLFDPDRWVYIYSIQIPDEPEIKQTLTLYFENGALARFTGDIVPTAAKPEGEAAAAPATGATAATAPATGAASAGARAVGNEGAQGSPVAGSPIAGSPAAGSPAAQGDAAPAPSPHPG